MHLKTVLTTIQKELNKPSILLVRMFYYLDNGHGKQKKCNHSINNEMLSLSCQSSLSTDLILILWQTKMADMVNI